MKYSPSFNWWYECEAPCGLQLWEMLELPRIGCGGCRSGRTASSTNAYAKVAPHFELWMILISGVCDVTLLEASHHIGVTRHRHSKLRGIGSMSLCPRTRSQRGAQIPCFLHACRDEGEKLRGRSLIVRCARMSRFHLRIGSEMRISISRWEQSSFMVSEKK